MQTTITYSKKQIANLLCSAFEGGSNYWYMIEKVIEPTIVEKHAHEDKIFDHIDYPLSPGGALVISDEVGCEGQPKRRRTLNLKSIQKGLDIMAQKYPEHFADWLAGNDDTTTSDVFLQCCIFGEIVYG